MPPGVYIGGLRKGETEDSGAFVALLDAAAAGPHVGRGFGGGLLFGLAQGLMVPHRLLSSRRAEVGPWLPSVGLRLGLGLELELGLELGLGLGAAGGACRGLLDRLLDGALDRRRL